MFPRLPSGIQEIAFSYSNLNVVVFPEPTFICKEKCVEGYNKYQCYRRKRLISTIKDKKTALLGIGGERVEKKRTFYQRRGEEEYLSQMRRTLFSKVIKDYLLGGRRSMISMVEEEKEIILLLPPNK